MKSAGDRQVRTLAAWAAVAASFAVICTLASCGGGAPSSMASAPPPGANAIFPIAGSTAGGTEVTILGVNFQSGATVSFGGTAATNVTVSSATQIVATTPAHGAGPVDLTVKNPDNQTATLSQAFTYKNPPPTVSGISPKSGPASGGTPVVITGTNFLSGATVAFDGASATSVTVTSGTQIQATTPAEAAGTVNVTVTNPDGQAGTLLNGFTFTGPPTVTAVSPNSGGIAGGTSVTITGQNFQPGATVSLGGTSATSVTVVSSTQIQATVPAHAAGAVSVTVTNPGGQQATLLNGFTYVAVSHSVGLAWNVSTSAVVGYNVYRGTVSGGPYSKLNLSLIAGTTYTDTSVLGGQTYFYVATALDSSNNESVYSNQVQAAVPSP